MRTTTTTTRPRRLVVPAWAALLAVLAALLGAVPADAAPTTARITLTGVIRTLAIDPVPSAGDRPAGPIEDVEQKVLLVGDRAYDLQGVVALNDVLARVVGELAGNRLTVTSVSALGDASRVASTPGTVGLGTLPEAGTTRVLTMLAYWTAPDWVTPEYAAQQMYGDSSAWYEDASYGALRQVGDVTPWLPIAAPTGGCREAGNSIMVQSREAAAALGYDLTSYDNFVVYFPRCGDITTAAGWAYVGAAGTWLNGYIDRRVITHEQGHNYGLWHSHSNVCTGGGLVGACTMTEYGDLYDAMGSSTLVGHFNASQKSLLGWMEGRTVDLTAGGTVTLAPMADDGMSAHAAVVRREDGTSYWLEYRQPTDFDADLPYYGTDGILVHASGPRSGSPDTGASLLDVRPSDGTSVYDATLRPGESWRSTDGVLVSVQSVTPAGATVTVTTGAIPQLQIAPSALAFPTTTVGARSAALTATISNTGTVPAPITSIAVTGQNAADFVKGASTCGTTLAAGASCSVPLTFVPTLDGARAAALTVVDGAEGSPHSVSLTGTASRGLLSSQPTPTITGTTAVGRTLTAVPGPWDAGTTLAYQWKRNGGSYIVGAKSPAYVLAAADLGATLTVSVTATKPGYNPATKTSATTATVVNATTLTGPDPTITGTAAVGSVLTVQAGAWSPSPVALAYQWRRAGAAITGATGTSYTPVAADAGAAVTVTVTGTKTGFTTVQKTSAPVTVTQGLLTSMPTPTISGATTVGSTLTAAPGTWDAGVQLAYQWKKNNGVFISGATGPTYVLRSTDAGAALTVSVTGTKAGYFPGTRTSATTAVVTTAPTTTIAGPIPTITGTATVGQTLTAVPGAWTPAPVALAYQWRRGGTAIAGATAATYRLVAADAKALITVSVTGTKTGFAAVQRTSAAVTAAPALMTAMPTPTITGTKTVGRTLTAVPGTWDAGVVLTYQWKRNGGNYITGATGSTYVLTDRDLGATLTVSVTGTKPGYSPATKTSATTTAVTAGALTPGTPTITGTARVGQTLTAVPGAWGPAPVTYAYQWKRGGVAITGATGSTYRTVAADGTKVVTVTVTGSKPGYTTVSRTSAGRTIAK